MPGSRGYRGHRTPCIFAGVWNWGHWRKHKIYDDRIIETVRDPPNHFTMRRVHLPCSAGYHPQSMSVSPRRPVARLSPGAASQSRRFRSPPSKAGLSTLQSKPPSDDPPETELQASTQPQLDLLGPFSGDYVPRSGWPALSSCIEGFLAKSVNMATRPAATNTRVLDREEMDRGKCPPAPLDILSHVTS